MNSKNKKLSKLSKAAMEPLLISDLKDVVTPDLRLKRIKSPIKKSRKKGKKVLKRNFLFRIFDFTINTVTPKPVRTMWEWIKKRIKEPSTYQGITVIAGATGVTLSPELFEAISAIVVSVIGLIQIIKKESKE